MNDGWVQLAEEIVLGSELKKTVKMPKWLKKHFVTQPCFRLKNHDNEKFLRIPHLENCEEEI
jgi:hypothetical protein